MIFLLRKKQLLQYISMYIFLVTHDELVQYSIIWVGNSVVVGGLFETERALIKVHYIRNNDTKVYNYQYLII